MRYHKRDQKKFLEELCKTGNVLTACAKSKIPKSTVYRWKNKDSRFSSEFERAFDQGRDYMCEISEGVIHKHIFNGSIRASEFYLRHNSPHYSPKKAVEPKKEKGVFTTLADLLREGFSGRNHYNHEPFVE